MTQEEIKEANKLIAKFVGKSRMYETSDDVFYAHLKYHKDWNALMPVVEKIAKIDDEKYSVSISSVGLWTCFINRDDISESEIVSYGGYEPMILNVWKSVVQFIKWHNTQPK